ncbi:hypothetical protein, partial [uncultured Ruegeria sp.]|uniref:hypothetical protein n=1 Tax=uncultured Ruegeria sp. TaxID=259304 RepID=UPI0026127D9E
QPAKSTNLPPNSTCKSYNGVRLSVVMMATFFVSVDQKRSVSLTQVADIATIQPGISVSRQGRDRIVYGRMLQ